MCWDEGNLEKIPSYNLAEKKTTKTRNLCGGLHNSQKIGYTKSPLINLMQPVRLEETNKLRDNGTDQSNFSHHFLMKHPYPPSSKFA